MAAELAPIVSIIYQFWFAIVFYRFD